MLRKLTIKDLATLRGCSYRTAQTEHKAIREKLGKHTLTLQDFAQYAGVTVQDLKKELGIIR